MAATYGHDSDQTAGAQNGRRVRTSTAQETEVVCTSAHRRIDAARFFMSAAVAKRLQVSWRGVMLSSIPPFAHKGLELEPHLS